MTKNFPLKFILIFLSVIAFKSLTAQTTITTTSSANTFWSASGGVIVFGVRNTNAFPINISNLGTYCPASHTATYTLWYNPTTVTGAPGAISTANGWVQLPVSYTVPTTSTAGIVPLFSSIGLAIPSNTIYRLALVASANGPYYTTSGSGADIFSGGGVDILTQANAASPTYVGPTTAPTTTPRGFFGSLTFAPFSPCTNPITAGATTASQNPVCVSTPFVLSLSGATLASGLTYQWDSSSNGTTWIPVNGATNATLSKTQISTSFYRCNVTCSGTTVQSTSLQVTSPALIPASSFTINKNIMSSPTNFQSFAAAFDYLKCGISGPIQFTVAQGSGPYTEQVAIPIINGVSSTNRITIKGNNETLTFSPTVATSRHTLWLNGADYLTVDSLNITTGGSVAGWAVVLTNQADSNIFKNCTIDVGNATSTSTNFIPVVINGANNSIATSGNNGNNNIFERNTILSGVYGFYLYGNATNGSTQNIGNVFRNNIVKDFYNYGVYMLYASTGTTVSKNDISRPARTNTGTTAGVYLNTGCLNVLVEKNKIHNLFDAQLTSTSACYGVQVNADGKAGSENKVINNLIYNFNGNGTHYGIYNLGGDSMWAYHNTIVLDDAAATGTGVGIYQTTAATGLNIRNNIISNTRGGTGIKRCLHFATTASTIVSNKNVLYLAAGGGSDNNIAQYGTTNFATLTNWQTANTNAYDQNSIDLNPAFANVSTADFTPTESNINGIGDNVGVTQDINDANRTATPDPGAIEFTSIVAGRDISMSAIVSPAVSLTGCYGNAETVSVRIRNNGTTDIDMATFPVSIVANITGTITQNINTSVNTGILKSDSTLVVNFPTTVNMSTIGLYNINATATVSGDVNTSNNTLLNAVSREKIGLSAGTITATPTSYCVIGGKPTLTSTGTAGFSSLAWQSSTTTGTGFTNIAGATTANYTLANAISQKTYFRLVATCSGSTQTSSEVDVVINNPQIATTTPGSRCGSGTVNLSASPASPSSTINWYNTPSGGTAIGTGTTFTTPSINATTTFYASAADGGGNGTVGPLAPTSLGTISASAFAIGTYYQSFDVLVPTTLVSIDVFPTASVGTNAAIEVRNSTGTTLISVPYTVSVTGGATAQTIPINLALTTGTGYRIGQGGTAINLNRNTSGAVYPYTSTAINVTGNNFDPVYWYYMYNWQFSTGCEGSRSAVVATVTSSPTISPSATKSVVCNGGNSTLSVSSSNTNYTYNWTPVNMAGSSVNVTPTATTKYYVQASDAGSGCAALDSLTITVQPTITAVAATPATFCVTGGTSLLTITPSSGYGANSLQWQTSTDNVMFTNVSGANGTTYSTPTITSTTYYRVQAKDGLGVVCNQQDVTVQYLNPQILTTVPRYTCGTGSVKLDATATPGATINWYAAATGGTPLATGTRFNTPSISTTTTYYVAANTSASIGASPIQITELDLGTDDRLEIQNVSPSSVDVTGWKVYINNSYTDINSVNSNVATLSGSLAPGATISYTDNTAGPNYWGSNILWNPGAAPTYTGWVIIVDNNNTIRDAVFLNWQAASIAGMNVTLGGTAYTIGSQWSGNGVDITTVAATQSISRKGSLDNNVLSDFEIVNLTMGATNSGLTLPMGGFGCESARTAVVATVDNSPGCVPLPVNLVSFTGKKEGSVNVLNWNTANEINNKGFYLQRSVDGVNFSEVAFIATKALDNGNNTSGLNYSYTDVKPSAANNYYRLVQQDKDGKTSLSHVVLIKGVKSDKVELASIYPNPFNSILNVVMSSPSNIEVKLVITDIAGRIVLQNTIPLKDGTNNMSLNTSGLTKGTYFIQAKCINGCNTSVQKIVKH